MHCGCPACQAPAALGLSAARPAAANRCAPGPSCTSTLSPQLPQAPQQALHAAARQHTTPRAAHLARLGPPPRLLLQLSSLPLTVRLVLLLLPQPPLAALLPAAAAPAAAAAAGRTPAGGCAGVGEGSSRRGPRAAVAGAAASAVLHPGDPIAGAGPPGAPVGVALPVGQLLVCIRVLQVRPALLVALTLRVPLAPVVALGLRLPFPAAGRAGRGRGGALTGGRGGWVGGAWLPQRGWGRHRTAVRPGPPVWRGCLGGVGRGCAGRGGCRLGRRCTRRAPGARGLRWGRAAAAGAARVHWSGAASWPPRGVGPLAAAPARPRAAPARTRRQRPPPPGGGSSPVEARTSGTTG
jgi:hypothetical protein